MTLENLETDIETIIETKRKRLGVRQEKTGMPAMTALAVMKTLEDRPKPFMNTVTWDEDKDIQLIGQIRLARSYDPVGTALKYNRNGVDALSIFTDERVYSRGLEDLRILARGLNALPIIVQDYALNEFHVAEMRSAGASAVMAYTDILDRPELRRITSITMRWQMTALVQISTEADLEYVGQLSPHVVCVGQYLTFDRERDLPLLKALKPHIPYHSKLMPLGCIHKLDDAKAVLELGVDAIIADESLILNAQTHQKLLKLMDKQ